MSSTLNYQCPICGHTGCVVERIEQRVVMLKKYHFFSDCIPIEGDSNYNCDFYNQGNGDRVFICDLCKIRIKNKNGDDIKTFEEMQSYLMENSHLAHISVPSISLKSVKIPTLLKIMEVTKKWI